MSKPIRESAGGAYEKRGQFFIRITIGPQKRTAEHAPWARSLDETIARARAIQGLVNRLRAAGKTDFVAKLVEIGAGADDAKMEDLDRFVDGVLGGAIVKVAPARDGALRISEHCRTWIAGSAALYDETTTKTLSYYAKKWEAFFGDDLTAVDAAALSRFVAARLGEVTRTTLKKELWGLRAFVTWAVEVAKVLGAVPAFPRLPKKATGTRTGRQREKAVELSGEQVAALLAALPDRARPRYTFAYETGLRPGTLDLLSVPEHYAAGASELVITEGIDKNRYRRTLPLSPGARAALEAVAPKRGLIFGRERYIDAFKGAVKKCGLPKTTAPYDLRHARATHAVEASGNLTGVAYLLGHKQVTTTNRYVHADQRAAADVLAALEGPRRPAEPPPAPPAGSASRAREGAPQAILSGASDDRGGSGGKRPAESTSASPSPRESSSVDEEQPFRFQWGNSCKGSSPFLRTTGQRNESSRNARHTGTVTIRVLYPGV